MFDHGRLNNTVLWQAEVPAAYEQSDAVLRAIAVDVRPSALPDARQIVLLRIGQGGTALARHRNSRP